MTLEPRASFRRPPCHTYITRWPTSIGSIRHGPARVWLLSVLGALPCRFFPAPAGHQTFGQRGNTSCPCRHGDDRPVSASAAAIYNQPQGPYKRPFDARGSWLSWPCRQPGAAPRRLLSVPLRRPVVSLASHSTHSWGACNARLVHRGAGEKRTPRRLCRWLYRPLGHVLWQGMSHGTNLKV